MKAVPLFDQGKIIAECPDCATGIIRYCYEFTPDRTDLAHWYQCDNWMCAVSLQIPYQFQEEVINLDEDPQETATT